MTIQGVIFDLDGVLVSTDELHYRAWKEMADAEGIPFDREVNHRLRGVSRMDSLQIILERARRSYSEAEKSAIADRKNARYREYLLELTTDDLLPGAADMLAALRRRGIKIAVASASKNASMILERLELNPLLDACADGNDVTRSKPDPEVFLLAANRLGLAPRHCLVVEDAAAGVEAARRAGMACFAIGAASDLPNVAFCAASLGRISCDQLLAAGAAQAQA